MTTTWGGRHHRNIHTFYYGGLRRRSLYAQCHGLALGKGSGFLDSRLRIFLSSRRVGFLSFPGQIGRLPAQYRFGGQPSKITKVQVLLGDGFHLQVGPDNSHGRSAKYAGDIDEPGFWGASSSVWAAICSPTPVVTLSFGLFSSAGTCGLAVLVICCDICGTGSSTVEAGLRLLSVGSPTVSQSSSSS
jgi:hypothetical protein